MATNPNTTSPEGKRVQYLIEDDIDFFNELRLMKQTFTNKTVTATLAPEQYEQKEHTKEEKLKEEKVGGVCLITNEPLTQFYVTLNCNHSFNYEPLYNEVKMQRNVKNFSGFLRCNILQLQCPFCRKINTCTLPYYSELDDKCPILYGVNTIDERYKIIKTCEYVKYIYTDGHKVFCNFVGDSLVLSKIDNKHYCYTHNHMVEQQHNSLLKHKERLEKAKKAKEEKQQQQLALKEKQKADKLAKQNASKTNVAQSLAQNLLESISGTNEVVLTPTSSDSAPPEPLCKQILKSGLFKGDPCNKAIFKYNMCKRHYKLSNAKLLPATEVVILPDASTSSGANSSTL